MSLAQLDDETLKRLERLSDRADPPPWRAMVEGRDHFPGDDFILVGADDDRREDIYVSRDSGPADSATLDLITDARNYLPLLVAEVQRLRELVP